MGIRIIVGIYLAAIIAANLIVNQFGPTASIYIAFVLIGLDLAIRDRLHEEWKDNLRRNMLILVVAGSVITIILNMGALSIAIASTVAFSVAFIIDGIVYHALRKQKYLIKANVSSLAGAGADSILFPTIAFGAFMPGIILGQWLAKVLGGFIWSLIISRFSKISH